MAQKPRLQLVKKSELPADSLSPPGHRSAVAREVWRETVVKMAAQGIPAIPADGVLIETLALAVARQRRIMAEIEAGPLQDEEGKINPLLRVAESTAATVGSVARALGLSPTARQRLPKAAAPQKANPIWDGIKP
jgi:P27 family predicted phage terminase small subunit